MKTLTYEKEINAAPEKVWDVLWSEATYPEWTKVFCEGSKAISDWKEGSTVQFTDGSNSGMLARIKSIKPGQEMKLIHEKELRNGEIVESKWAGGNREDYFLTPLDGGRTLLKAELEAQEGEMADYFEKTFPSALDKVKEIAEK